MSEIKLLISEIKQGRHNYFYHTTCIHSHHFCCVLGCDAGTTLSQHSVCRVCRSETMWIPCESLGKCIFPANTKHLYNIWTTPAQRLRRWSNFVQMLYKCFVFTGLAIYFNLRDIGIHMWAVKVVDRS